jgi:pimeloyl-ACP methyl ester carboxylesterase
MGIAIDLIFHLFCFRLFDRYTLKNQIMKSITKILLLAVWAISFQPTFGQMEREEVSGSWLGTLDLGSMSIRLIFNISPAEEGDFKATMDSPDQGRKDVPLGHVSVDGDSLRIDAPMLQGFYLGKFTSPSSIGGTWNQAGRSFALDLEKQSSAFVLKRPQEPKAPFPYKAEEVSFPQIHAGFTLGGTLTLPEGEGPFPAVVMITGSGSQNRDEEIFGHKPFWVIADHLSRSGIAVLRYDDRGVAASGGMATGATTADLAIDARSAMDYLLSRSEVDPSRLGLVGHSEGGLIAFMLGSEHSDISFIISLAGPGVDGLTILLEQSEYISRLSGISEPVVEDNRIVMGKVYDMMLTNEAHNTWREEVIEFTSSYYSNQSTGQYSEEDIEQVQRNLLGSIPEPAYAWMRYFVMSDPTSYFTSIACPVLAFNGGRDCQVLAEKNINAIKKGLQDSGNKQVTAMILPGLNHLFQNCTTGLPSEYNLIEETFDPNTLQLMTAWILQLE